MGQLGLLLAVISPKTFAQAESPEQKKVTFLECGVCQITSYLLTQAVCDQNCSVAKRQQKIEGKMLIFLTLRKKKRKKKITQQNNQKQAFLGKN